MNCNCRLEKEIEALEKEEIKVSAKEEAILKKLKSVDHASGHKHFSEATVVQTQRGVKKLYCSSAHVSICFLGQGVEVRK